MLPLPQEMDGVRPLEANFTADNSKTRYIMEIVIIEREAFETFMAEVSKASLSMITISIIYLVLESV